MNHLSTKALNRACDIIEAAEQRQLACDGPVGATVQALTTQERDELFKLLQTATLSEGLLRKVWKERARRLHQPAPEPAPPAAPKADFKPATPQGPVGRDAYTRENLQKIARMIDEELPQGWGFALFAFPLNAEPGRLNYVANGVRADIVATLKEWLKETGGSLHGHH